MRPAWSSLLAAAVLLPAPGDLAQRAEELKGLKWGMFVCWSFSTFSGKEWTPGVKDVDYFKATGCDTEQWAQTAKEAGMGYILFLTKHHDGFCLWDTKTTERKVTNSPLGRDVLAELRKSCDRHGIKLALYFSEGEFDDNKDYHPGGYTPGMKKAQLQELLTQYGPVEFIWFDHAQGTGGVNHKETVEWCRRFQPGCLIGFNHGDPAGEIRLGERGKPAPLEDPAGAGFGAKDAAGYKGYLLAEFTYPLLPPHKGGADWFYSLPKHDNRCFQAKKLYRDYLGAVKYGNIFSINVGPDYAGKLRKVDVETLRKVGEMIRNTPRAPLTTGKKASASSTWADPGFGPESAFDDDEKTRWEAAKDARSGWLEVDLGEPAAVRRAAVVEGPWNRIRRFEVQAKEGDLWKTVASGGAVGERKELTFDPVTARFFRLNIPEAVEVPTVLEFQLFPPTERSER